MLNLIVMMSQPIFKDGILERNDASFAIKNVFFNQGLERPRCCRGTAYMVSVHGLGTRYSFFPCNNGMKVTNLLECEGFNKVGEKETELFNERFMSLCYNLFSTLRGGSEPRKLRKLLDIVWMIVCESNDFLASAFRDSFSCGREPLCNEWDKMICINLIQEKKVTELIKWHGRVREDLKHHVTLTPIKAIARFLVLLPVSTQLPLEEKRVVKFRDVLEFINTNHNLYPLRLGDPFRKIKNLIGVPFHFVPIKVNGNLIHRVSPDGYFWNQTREELLRVFHSLIPSGCSPSDDATGEHRIKLLLSFDIKKVYCANFELFILILCNGCCLVNERTFSPTPWRNDDCVDERFEIVYQMSRFLLPVCKILVCGNLAEYERCFHPTVCFITAKV